MKHTTQTKNESCDSKAKQRYKMSVDDARWSQRKLKEKQKYLQKYKKKHTQTNSIAKSIIEI